MEGQTSQKAMEKVWVLLLLEMLYEKFDGKSLYLIYLKLDNYLSEDKLVNHVGSTDVFILAIVKVWIHDMIIWVNEWYIRSICGLFFCFILTGSKYLWIFFVCFCLLFPFSFYQSIRDQLCLLQYFQ